MSEASPPVDDPQHPASDAAFDADAPDRTATPPDDAQEGSADEASPLTPARIPVILPPETHIDTTHRTLEMLAIRSSPAPHPRRWIVQAALIVLAILIAVPIGLSIGGINGEMLSVTPTPTVPVSDLASSATITFTRTSQTLTASPVTVIAAISGGQVAATEVDVSVHQVQSAPIDAPQDPTTHLYTVPSGCGDTGPAYTATSKGLNFELQSRSPGGSIVFYGPAIGYDPSSLTCYPNPETASNAPFQYVERLDGSGFHVYYLLIDVQLLQIARIEKQVPAHNAILAVHPCSGVPKMSNQGRSSVTVACPTTAIVGWDWSQAQLQSVLAQVQGIPLAAALQLLNHTPGIVAGSAKITLANGSALPANAGEITVQVQG